MSKRVCPFCNNDHDELRCPRGATIDLERVYKYIEELEYENDRLRLLNQTGPPR